jgi:threonine dehydratase
VRHTPLIPAANVRAAPCANLSLKLECLQVSGSFKARGASNTVAQLSDDQIRRGLITASGGNHGLGVAYAGWRAGAPVSIYLPGSTPKAKAAKLEAWGAQVTYVGEVWDDANAAALEEADKSGLTYVHPFADPAVIAGQGTTALEILDQAPDTDVIVISIGGGGLISGCALAAKAVKPDIRIIGVEPVGAPTLSRSVAANDLVKLDAIETRAGTLAPRQSARINLDLIRANVDDIVLVDDDAMTEAARWLWFEMGLAVELSAAAAIAALQTRTYTPDASDRVCALVCGAGTDGLS